jgi:hypothetical protein
MGKSEGISATFRPQIHGFVSSKASGVAVLSYDPCVNGGTTMTGKG